MVASLIVALRPAIEVAILVALGFTFLARELEPRAGRAAWTLGLAAGILAGLAVALVADRPAIDWLAIDGVLALGSALALGVGALPWVWRRSSLSPASPRDPLPGAWRARAATRAATAPPSGRPIAPGLTLALQLAGIAAVAAVVVARGAVCLGRTVAAPASDSAGSGSLLGAALGLLLAITFGALVVYGGQRVDLGRCLGLTAVALALDAVWLGAGGLAQLAAAGRVPMPVESLAALLRSRRLDALVLAGLLLLPLVGVLRPGRRTIAESTTSLAVPAAANPQAVLARRHDETRRRWARFAAIGLAGAALLVLFLGR